MLHALAAEETIVRRHTKPRPHSLSLDMHAYLNGTVRQEVRQAAFNLSTAVAKGSAEREVPRWAEESVSESGSASERPMVV